MSARVRHIATILLSLIIGGTFIFSGFVKSVDPVGTSIFVEKYLATYSLEVLMPMAILIAVVLGAMELMLGILLFVGAYRSRAACGATLFLAIFTIITLLSATILPIGDCGCFGDAVKLTPWQTFYKNIALLPMSVALWLLSRREGSGRWSIEVLVLSSLFALGVNCVALRFLPLIDFMPYKVGLNLRDEVAAVNEAESSSVRSVLLFENIATGESVEYPSDAVDCWMDENLEYIDAYTIHDDVEPMTYDDFRVYNAESEDITISLLEREGSVVWLCINSVDALDGIRLKAAKSILDDSSVIVTSSDAGRVTSILDKPCYAIDAMTLRSFIRAAVGVVVIDDGVISLKRDVRDYNRF